MIFSEKIQLIRKRNDVGCVSILQRMSNTWERIIRLDIDMEDYHRRFANAHGVEELIHFTRTGKK